MAKDFMSLDPHTGRRHAYAAPAGGKGQVRRSNSQRHARGGDDDRRQIIADLISSDDTPFVPDDDQALRMMTDDGLRALKGAYLPQKVKVQRRTNCADGISKDDLDAAVRNAVAEALAEHAADKDDPDYGDAYTEARARAVTKAKKLLAALGIDDPDDKQLTHVVTAIMDSAEDLGDDDEDVKAMSSTAAQLAAEAEARGDTRKAQRLRKHAADEERCAGARRTAEALAAPARRLAAARPVTNADDDDVKAMSEFHGDDAFARALAKKKR